MLFLLFKSCIKKRRQTVWCDLNCKREEENCSGASVILNQTVTGGLPEHLAFKLEGFDSVYGINYEVYSSFIYLIAVFALLTDQPSVKLPVFHRLTPDPVSAN